MECILLNNYVGHVSKCLESFNQDVGGWNVSSVANM